MSTTIVVDERVIHAANNLSPKTKQAYITRLNLIVSRCGSKRDLTWVCLHPDKAVAALSLPKADGTQYNQSTMASMCVAVCKLMSLVMEPMNNNRVWMKAYTQWNQYLKEFRQAEEEKTINSRMSDRQNDVFVDWHTVQSKYCELRAKWMMGGHGGFTWQEHMDFLLLAVLMNLKPKRADLGEVEIVEEGAPFPSCPNYIMINRKTNSAVLVLTQYKTVKKNGRIMESLPDELYQILIQSLSAFPRKHLFVSPMERKPYNNNTYSTWVRRTSERLFGKKMGVSMWRHVYVRANVNFNDTSYKNIHETAKLLGHSVEMMFKTYRKVDMDMRPVGEQGQAATCDDKKEAV